MSAEQLSAETEDTQQYSSLAIVLARGVLESKATYWQPDFLSKQLANEVADEIGPGAQAVPARLRTLHSTDGSTFGVRIDPNIISITSRL